ncbi:hypothetical protein DFJ73DRAFT_868707 [Zopfochytrium polystomum]|nr:hypothetical protein DFJ73DRAFT_868707 [Zopfochytrium polystomum]
MDPSSPAGFQCGEIAMLTRTRRPDIFFPHAQMSPELRTRGKQIGRIEDKHLLLSLVGAMLSYFIASITTAVIDRLDFPWEKFIQMLNITVFCGGMVFALLLYHTSYRAMLLIFPYKQHLKWVIAATVAIIELTLNLADLSLFEVIFRADIIHYQTTSAQKSTSITLITYVCTLDTVFFALTQARIVAVMGQMSGVNVSVWHYVEGAIRCMFYSGAVLLYYLSTSGLAYPPQEGVTFINIAPCILFIVLLTDSDRIKKLVAELNSARSTMTALSSAKKSSAGGATGMTSKAATSTNV